VVIAVDKVGGGGAKIFNVVHRDDVMAFVSKIPDLIRRNAYVLVDDAAPCNPFFDVDGASVPAEYRDARWADAVPFAHVAESVLLDVLTEVYDALEGHFHASIGRCVVLTASQCSAGGSTGKLSFHCHFEMEEPHRNCFRNVEEQRDFASHWQEALRSRVAKDARDLRALVTLHCVDFSVYTKWRAFRLPYCAKEFDVSGMSVTEREEFFHRLSSKKLSLSPPAVAQSVCLPSDLPVRLLMPICFRKTTFEHEPSLQELMERRPLRMAEDDHPSPLFMSDGACKEAFDLALINRQDLSYDLHGTVSGFPSPERLSITSYEKRELLAEVFRCLHARFNSCDAITGGSVHAAFEDARVRAYYVYQKKSRFCVNLQRDHKGTYSQLYLTYRSIKVRCYSNDCFASCFVVPWWPDDPSHVAGETPPPRITFPDHYPKYERLREIRSKIFPDLTDAELRSRYGGTGK
jgi:hypothetical protein